MLVTVCWEVQAWGGMQLLGWQQTLTKGRSFSPRFSHTDSCGHQIYNTISWLSHVCCCHCRHRCCCCLSEVFTGWAIKWRSPPSLGLDLVPPLRSIVPKPNMARLNSAFHKVIKLLRSWCEIIVFPILVSQRNNGICSCWMWYIYNGCLRKHGIVAHYIYVCCSEYWFCFKLLALQHIRIQGYMD